jgi:hypothetical protein
VEAEEKHANKRKSEGHKEMETREGEELQAPETRGERGLNEAAEEQGLYGEEGKELDTGDVLIVGHCETLAVVEQDATVRGNLGPLIKGKSTKSGGRGLKRIGGNRSPAEVIRLDSDSSDGEGSTSGMEHFVADSSGVSEDASAGDSAL